MNRQNSSIYRLGFFLILMHWSILSIATTSDIKTNFVEPSLQKQVRQTFLFNPQGSFVVAGGSWTGSGGNGVACFKDSSEALEAMDSTGRIKQEFRSKIQRVLALDTWEFQKEFGFLPPKKNEKPVDYILRAIDEHLQPDMSYFADKLKKSIAILNASEWNSHWTDQGALPLLLDQGSLRTEIPPHCRLIQLAIRYAHSTPGKVPKLFIDVDKDLIERMSNGPSWTDNILFTGTLLLHETIWMLGVELNMPDSVGSRHLTAAILSTSIAKAISDRPLHMRKKLWTGYIYSLGFRDYYSLFLGEEKIDIDPKAPRSKASRRFSRANLSRVYKKTLQELHFSERGQMSPEQEDKFIQQLHLSMTTEEAFLFLTQTFANAKKILYDLDIFYLDGLDDRPLINFSCNMIRTYYQFFEEGGDKLVTQSYLKVMAQALQYCSK